MKDKEPRRQPQLGRPEREPQPKPTRLFIEQDNGKVRYLEGEGLQKWLKDVNGALGFMQITRKYMLADDFMKVEWKEVDRSEMPKLFETPPTPQTPNA